MKVVINTSWGGFGLSPKATKRLAELNGRKCYFYIHGRNENGQIDIYSNVLVSMTQATKEFLWTAYDVPNIDEVLPSDADWNILTVEEQQARSALYAKHSIESRHFESRADHKLIQVVEELGSLANGAYAKLKIVEIPDGIEYEIDDYDGMESVHEKHKVWS
jgi:hypothetical protein